MTVPEVCRPRCLNSAFSAILAIGFACGGMLVAPTWSAAQDTFIYVPQRLTIKAGTVEALPLKIAAGSVPTSALLLISGLPPTASLTAGRMFASGTWALRLSDLDGLKIETRLDAAGQVPLALSVVTLDGRVVAERTVSLIFASASTAETSAPAERAIPDPRTLTPTAALPAPTTAEQALELRKLMAQGDANLAAGKVQVARLFYRRAAEAGWAQGALAMAHTFDPQELNRLSVVGGVQPDLALAKQWYEKAMTLGSPEAQGGLSRLGQR